jgi:hypothetical protein
MSTMEPLTARLEGSIVVLEPLGERHAEELWEAAQAPEIWDWLVNLNASRELFDYWLEASMESAREGSEGPFATRLRSSGKVVGSSRYLNVRPRTASSRSAGRGSIRAPGGPAPTSRPSC